MRLMFSKRPILIVATVLLIVTVGVVWLYFDRRTQQQRAGFTMISKQVFTANNSKEKQLGAIQVRFQNAAGSWRQVTTYLNPNGTVRNASDTGGYTEAVKSEEMLRQDSHFVREEYVMGYKTLVLRIPTKDAGYTEMFFAPELQGMPIRNVFVSNAGVEVIEPTKIEMGEPEIRLWSESAEK